MNTIPHMIIHRPRCHCGGYSLIYTTQKRRGPLTYHVTCEHPWCGHRAASTVSMADAAAKFEASSPANPAGEI